MGIGTSKSPLERRNTEARRTQRRTIHSIKAKVDKVFVQIKKFRGTNKDEGYNAIYLELEQLQNELQRKSKHLQPQVRNLYNTTLKRIDGCFAALDYKLRENEREAKKKERERKDRAEKKKNNDEEEISIENNEVEEEQDKISLEANNLERSLDKRKTVELKFVAIEMAIKNSSSNQDPTVTNLEENSDTINIKINEIIENLQAIEYQLEDFKGKKDGTQYNRIKNKLISHMGTLDEFSPSDDYTIDQVKTCRNYIVRCLDFLEEKAVDEEKNNDIVFA